MIENDEALAAWNLYRKLHLPKEEPPHLEDLKWAFLGGMLSYAALMHEMAGFPDTIAVSLVNKLDASMDKIKKGLHYRKEIHRVNVTPGTLEANPDAPPSL